MSKHTPGPWLFDAINNNHMVDVWQDNGRSDYHLNAKSICECHWTRASEIENGEIGASLAEAEANARLIAAAPKLLEMLQMIAAPFDAAAACGMPMGEATITSDSQMLKNIRAVIAKATGEQP